MDDPLERLIGELRGERCPRSVQERVARRIAAAKSAQQPHGWRIAWVGAAAALLAVLGFGALRLGPTRERLPESTGQRLSAHTDPAAVAEQTQVAFAIVGRVLIHAGGRAEQALLHEAVPPLVDSFLSAKEKLTPSL